jgi:signal transduction histidine kinase
LTLLPISLGVTGIWLAWPGGLAENDVGLRLLVVLAFAGAWEVLARIRTARSVAVVLLSGALIAAVIIFVQGLMWRWMQPYWQDILDVRVGSTTVATIMFVTYRSAMALWPVPPIVLMQVFPTGVIPRLWARLLFGLTLAVYAFSIGLEAIAEFRGDRDTEFEWAAIGASLFLSQLAGIFVLACRFFSGTSIVRRQLAAFGLLQICLTVFLVASLSSGQEWSTSALSLVFVLWAIGVVGAIFLGMSRYSLYDVRFVIRKVALHSVATVLLSGVFVVVYVLISAILSQALDLGDYRWVAVIAAVGVVLVLDPFRRRLIGRVDDRFFGDRRQPLRAFAKLHPSGPVNRDEATYDSILEAVVSAVRAPGAALDLREGSADRTVATLGSPGEQPLVMPISYHGELLGHVRIGPRTPGEQYPSVDLILLEHLITQAAAQIYGVRRDQELAQTRREALTAIADERGRLGRDLHDGLAPLLAGAGLTAEALRLDLAPGSAGDRDAARLAERLRHAAGEVRRIAHGLDPGEINENLAGAVTNYLDSLSGPNRPKFSAYIKVDQLPPVVANAAYLVVLEAVNNVIRHAAAHQVRVQVRRARNDLLLRIADDGCGIPQPYVSGLGITSMRKRVEALGGRFTIGAQDAGGTLIAANIPIAP